MRAARALVSSCLAAFTTCAVVAEAAPPTVEYIYPSGGQRGTTVTVTAGGKFEPWPVKMWTDSPDLKFEPVAATNGAFNVQIGQSVPMGPHLVRFYNGEGASALRVFLVGEQREIVETEPNDDVGKAQSVEAMPMTVNGQLEKAGDVDAFAVRLEAGQCLVASLAGRRLGAPMDPMLHLFDEAGNEIAFAHDGAGLDPLLTYRAANAGRYVVRVSGFAHPPAAEIRLTGAKTDVYRLNLTTGPFVRWACPAAVKRGERRALLLSGWNLASQLWDADATAVKPGTEFLPVSVGASDTPLRIEFSDLTEHLEADVQEAQVLATPFGVTGRLAMMRDEDRFKFTGKKGERYLIVLRGGWFESHFDPVLRVADPAGKELARDDDGAGSGDARIEFAIPEDGTYQAVVSDLNRQGGEDFDYRITVQKPAPRVTATVAAHELRVAPGKSAPVKLNVNRQHGHAGELVAVATGLPEGVSSSSANFAASKGGEVEITLTAAASAKAASGPIRFMLLGTSEESPFARPATYNFAADALAQSLIDSTDAVWLTVLPPPATQPAKPTETPAKK